LENGANFKNALLFCDANACKAEKMEQVADILDEFSNEIIDTIS
jgi:hypothetical protein